MIGTLLHTTCHMEVMIIRKQGLEKVNKLQLALLFTIVTISLSLIGLGLAAWQDNLDGLGYASTGDIDVYFVGVELSGDKTEKMGADISPDGKSIRVYINDVGENEVIELYYQVANDGSIPIKFYTQVENSNLGLQIENSLSGGFVGGSQHGWGYTKIEVGQIESLETYNFNIRLHFQQWN